MPHPDWASSGVPLFTFLFFVVFIRAQGTYWLGRAAAVGVLAGKDHEGVRGRLAAWFNGPVPARGARLLERWGLIIIPLCFLTVGVQTAVNAGSGVLGMKWRTYTLAMIPGCIAWSAMYGLGMMAVWMAVLGAVAGSPWAWALIAVIAAGLGTHVMWRRRHPRLTPDLADSDGRCALRPELPNATSPAVAPAVVTDPTDPRS